MVRELISPCRVIHIDTKVGDNSEVSLTAVDIIEHESAHGMLPAGSVVLVYTGWSRRYILGSEAYMGIVEGSYDNSTEVPPLRFFYSDSIELI